MKAHFEWLVKHEKLIAVITICLVATLVAQMKFCHVRVEPEVNLLQIQPQSSPIQQSSGSNDIAGEWVMSVQKKNGGTQRWTLTLEQKGEVLKGLIGSEGGDLPVNGTIKGESVNLSAKRYGVTVEFEAKLNGETMKGTMRALIVTRDWTATRK